MILLFMNRFYTFEQNIYYIKIKMSEIKYPMVYILDIKRGVKWSERKVELHKDRIKYFNPSKDNF
jgi:hypothetical protein